MKNIEIKRRWLVIFLAIFIAFLAGSKMFSWYYVNHFMPLKALNQISKGGGTFYLKGLEIKIPEHCAVESSDTSEPYVDAGSRDAWKDNWEDTWFICATLPTSFQFVHLKRSIPDAKAWQRIKNLSEQFTESDEYIHAIIGPKMGLPATSYYYLKHQNITVSSDSQELAKKFAYLLVKYNFRVGEVTPLDKLE